MGVRHLTAKGDYMFSFDLQDGFYALGIAPSDRDYFTVNIRGTLYRLCGLPMGWSLSPYYFTTFTMTFVKHLRSPATPAAPGNVPRSRRWLRQLEAMWGVHSVDRFASALNAMLPRYNAAWLDPNCEAVDSLHLSDAEWRRENRYCNPPR
eukprot:jgi/Tetstr1/433925/TSEL_023102.t1